MKRALAVVAAAAAAYGVWIYVDCTMRVLYAAQHNRSYGYAQCIEDRY